MSARADLCGGRLEMIVPTATVSTIAGLETCIALFSTVDSSGRHRIQTCLTIWVLLLRHQTCTDPDFGRDTHVFRQTATVPVSPHSKAGDEGTAEAIVLPIAV